MVFIYLFIDVVPNTQQASRQKTNKQKKRKQITKLACDIDLGYISYLTLLFTLLIAIEKKFGHEL